MALLSAPTYSIGSVAVTDFYSSYVGDARAISYDAAVADRMRLMTEGQLDGRSRIKNRPTMAEFQAQQQPPKKETALPMFTPSYAQAPGGYRAVLLNTARQTAWESVESYEESFDAQAAATEALRKIEAAAITTAGLKPPAVKVVPSSLKKDTKK